VLVRLELSKKRNVLAIAIASIEIPNPTED